MVVDIMIQSIDRFTYLYRSTAVQCTARKKYKTNRLIFVVLSLEWTRSRQKGQGEGLNEMGWYTAVRLFFLRR